MDKYFVKSGYRPNPHRDFFDSDAASWMYQAATYEFARDLIVRHRLESVLDLGCGFGTKLAEFIRPVCADITGVDTEHAIAHCRARHDFGTWICDDLERPRADLGRRFDLVLAADVIEHLVDPDTLLDYIRRSAHATTLIVISTPERDLARGEGSLASDNETHVREWNESEFDRYVRSRGFDISEHFMVEAARRRGVIGRIRLAAARLFRETRTTQVVVCRVRPPSQPEPAGANGSPESGGTDAG